MASQPVEAEIRDPGQSTNKPQSGALSHEQIHAVDESGARLPWWRRHGMKLCFLLGWILFPFWWGASIVGFRKRHILKGWERAAWIASIFLSLAGLIIFLIFIIWYGADPEGEKRRLLHRDNGGATQTSSGDIVLSKFGVKMSGACSDSTYDSLVNSVKTAIMADASLAANSNQLTFSRGQPCYTSSSRRHLLQGTISNYEVLVKAVSGSSPDVQQQLFTSLQARVQATGGAHPGWCGQFCTDNSVIGTSYNVGDDWVTCDKASNGGAYTCKSGTLIASNYANKNSPSDTACCTTCALYNTCPTGTARTGVTLAANQEPTFELCCNPCAAIPCDPTLGPVTPAPALDNTTTPTDAICCVQAPVVAPAMTLTFAAPGCNATNAKALANQTLTDMTSGLDRTSSNTIDVKGVCTTGSSGRRLLDDTGDHVQLTCRVRGVKTVEQALQASKVLLGCLGFNASDIVNATDPQKIADVLKTLKQNTRALGHLLNIIERAKPSGFNFSTSPSNCDVSPPTLNNAVCPGQPSLPHGSFPLACIGSEPGADCTSSCSENGKFGLYTCTCGTDGHWTTPKGSCQPPNSGVQLKNCTGNPTAVPNAQEWPNCANHASCSVNCTFGYQGTPSAVCNVFTGNWSKPNSGCTPVICPTPWNKNTVWPPECSLMGDGSSCNATCQSNARGNPPQATCTLAPNGNSASWNVTNQGKCFAEDTCTGYTADTLNGNKSAICTNSSLNYLQNNVSCWDPAAGIYIPQNKTNCTADICCRAPKTCGTTPNLTCNAAGSPGPRFLRNTICAEEKGTPACTVAGCCVQNTTCGSSQASTYKSCPSQYTVKTNTLCGPGTENPSCDATACCAPPTCSSWSPTINCGVKQELIPSYVCLTGTCNSTMCCRNKTCTGYSCPAGATLKSPPANITCTNGTCDDIQCCNNATCGAYTCSNASKVVPPTSLDTHCSGPGVGACNDTQCACQLSCIGFHCPSNGASLVASPNLWLCDNGTCNATQCCDPATCGVSYTGTCNVTGGYGKNPAASCDLNAGCSNTTCCYPTCKLFNGTCPGNSTARANSTVCAGNTCNSDDCCLPPLCSTFGQAGCNVFSAKLISDAATTRCNATSGTCDAPTCCAHCPADVPFPCAPGSTASPVDPNAPTWCAAATCAAEDCCIVP